MLPMASLSEIKLIDDVRNTPPAT
jgi:hypothetical protein